ncbi:MAG: hypothetical protein ABEJ26_07070 [Halosimplex sp.]
MGEDTPDDAEAPDDPETADRRENPFDAFDDRRDREGDPFASLGDGPGDRRSGEDRGSGTTGDGNRDPGPEPRDAGSPAVEDPFEYVEDRGSEGDGDFDSGEFGGEDSPRAGDPLAGVDVSDADPFESSGSAFERTGVEGIDPDDVWERLTADPEERAEGPADGAARLDGEDAPEEETVEVSKHAYCEGCEHFSAPPDVSCSHEGTAIVEFVGLDGVRVANCPVVAERRDLEEDA